MDVTVVHLGPWLLERQLDKSPAACCSSRWRQGTEVPAARRPRRCCRGTDGRATGRARCAFRTAWQIPADLVVMAAGIRPTRAGRVRRASPAGRGIVVDDTMQTVTDPRIYAVGECVSHRGIAYGLVAPLFEQARCAPTTWPTSASAATRLGDLDQAQGHRHRPVLGRRLQGGQAGTEEITCSTTRRAAYKKLVIRTTSSSVACCTATPPTALVFPAAEGRPRRRRDPRPPDLRPETRSATPAMPANRAAEMADTPRSAAATASARARSRQGDQERACSASTRSRSTPRRPRPAAPAPAWSSRSRSP